MTLQQLHYAIVISETGSMNKAAERLYIAQPSLTGAMQELERELGITIFHRSGRGVTLTNDGQEFIDYARQVYHQYETLAEKYAHPNELKKKFGVTTQHYSFAVKAFVEMAKSFDTAKYDFAIRENVGDRIRTRHSVIERMLNSEIIIDNDTTTVERLLEEYDSQNVIEDGRKTLHISVPNQSIDITIDREKAGLEVKANGKRVKVQTGGDKTESAEPDSVRQPDAGRVPAEQTE